MSASLIGTMLWRARINFGSGLQDITNQVQVDAGAVIRRGRSDEQSSTTPASLSLSLKNSSGDFTPENRDSQYWPGVKLRAPIVVDVSFDGGANWINRFTGGVDEWPQAFPGQVSTLAWTPLVASGVLRQYGQGAASAGPALRRQVVTTAPKALWPLTDPTGSTTAFNLIDSRFPAAPATSTDVVTWASVDGPDGMAAQVAAVDGELLIPPLNFAPLSLEVWWKPLDNGCELFSFGQDATGAATSFELRSFNSPFVGAFLATYGVRSATSAAVASVNGWYHTVATFFANGASSAVKLYVQGALLATDTGSETATATSTGGVLLNAVSTAVGYMAFYDKVLSAAEVLANYQAGLAWTGETAGARHNRLCTEAGITAATSTAATLMGAQPDKTVPDLLAEGAVAEWAPLVETTGGSLDLHPRTERYTDTAALTVSTYRDLTPTYDDKDVCNTGYASRPGGSYRNSEDTTRSAAPPSGEGRYLKSLEVNVSSDNVLANYAAWLVATGVPQTRFRQVPIRYGPANLTALAAWCAAELNQLIDVSGLPGLLATDTFDGFLESYTETWTYNCCDVVLTLSAGHPWIDTFELDDTILGRLACSGQTMNANAIAGATSISVATSANNALLTTAAGDYPLDLMVNGYKIHATACSGVSSPQTVTVTALAHALTSGQEVTLWTKPVLGL